MDRINGPPILQIGTQNFISILVTVCRSSNNGVGRSGEKQFYLRIEMHYEMIKRSAVGCLPHYTRVMPGVQVIRCTVRFEIHRLLVIAVVPQPVAGENYVANHDQR